MVPQPSVESESMELPDLAIPLPPPPGGEQDAKVPIAFVSVSSSSNRADECKC